MVFMLHQFCHTCQQFDGFCSSDHYSNLATTMRQIWFRNVSLACEVLLYTDSHCSSRQLSSQLRNINNQEKVSVKYCIFSHRPNLTEYKNSPGDLIPETSFSFSGIRSQNPIFNRWDRSQSAKKSDYFHMLIQSKNHASNKGKMAGRCLFDTHPTGIGLRAP